MTTLQKLKSGKGRGAGGLYPSVMGRRRAGVLVFTAGPEIPGEGAGHQKLPGTEGRIGLEPLLGPSFQICL